jgi:hypothetical protein
VSPCLYIQGGASPRFWGNARIRRGLEREPGPKTTGSDSEPKPSVNGPYGAGLSRSNRQHVLQSPPLNQEDSSRLRAIAQEQSADQFVSKAFPRVLAASLSATCLTSPRPDQARGWRTGSTGRRRSTRSRTTRRAMRQRQCGGGSRLERLRASPEVRADGSCAPLRRARISPHRTLVGAAGRAGALPGRVRVGVRIRAVAPSAGRPRRLGGPPPNAGGAWLLRRFEEAPAAALSTRVSELHPPAAVAAGGVAAHRPITLVPERADLRASTTSETRPVLLDDPTSRSAPLKRDLGPG